MKDTYEHKNINLDAQLLVGRLKNLAKDFLKKRVIELLH